MDIERLIREVQRYDPQCDADFLRRAYLLAEKVYGNLAAGTRQAQLHDALLTARLLAELHLDPPTIVAAFLHGIRDYGGVPRKKIAADFGEETAGLVEAISRLDRITWDSLEEEKAEGLRKMFLAMADDLRVVLIRLGEQIVKMRRLGEFKETERNKIVRESMILFAPLTNRLGIWAFKRELQNLALRSSDPEGFHEIVRRLDESQESRERDIGAVVKAVRKELNIQGIPAEVSGRPKHIYSIYQKMKRSGRPFEEIHDVRGIRIVVRDIKDCYAVLDVVHRLWKPKIEEFDDYIAHPKNRIYRSLHTTVSGPGRKTVEIQIRTSEMDKTAELGVAAHWRYKEKLGSRLGVEEKIAYLRGLLDWRQDVPVQASPEQEHVYVFTPKGDVLELPTGATPLDFAYLIHTGLGHCCRGAKVNGKLVPLDHKMQTGDRVEIITVKKLSPSRDWLNPRLGYVRTRQARQKISQWFRKKDREEEAARGRELLERELKRSGIKEKNYDAMARLIELGGSKELFEAVACGAVNPHHIVSKIAQSEGKKEERPERFTSVPRPPGPDGILVKGEKGFLTRQALCCRPLPGEKVVGYITRGRGVSIHRYDCHNVAQQKGSPCLVEVEWGKEGERSLSSVKIVGTARKDWLKDFASIVEDEKAGIFSLNVVENREAALTTAKALLEIDNIGQLNRILRKTRKLTSVIEAKR